MVGNTDARIALVLLTPLIGAIVSYFSGRISRRLSATIATLAVVFSCFASLSLWSELDSGKSFTFTLGSWFSFDKLQLPLQLVFDRLSALMCLVITGIGALIHVYSIGYMADDEGSPRFFAYLNLFVASMLLLVLGSSLPVLFIGWEGVGLCSYLLIGFWFSNPDYAKAGRKAFVMNRVGDIGLMVAMFALYTATGTLDIHDLNTPDRLGQLGSTVALIAGLGLFLAATGKSAQIPLFTWLPDAMAGPTPVSALIHAATMVTAGVYLMARMHGVIELDPFVPALICWTAVATALVAGTIALVQNDIKKVLAYSTVSQLGFMFIAVGVGQYWVALFHVVTHAFFKACLFLSAGSVIHGCHHEQDMRKMGGLMKFMPATCAAYGIALLAIAGIWPFAGFFSKHAILDSISATTNPYLISYASCLGWSAKGLAVLTALYMARSFALTFLGTFRGTGHPHEAPLLMTIPVLTLAVLSVGGGWYLDHRLPEYLAEVAPSSVHLAHAPLGVGGVVVGSLPGILGLALAVILFLIATDLKDAIRKLTAPLEWMFAGKYFADELLNFFVIRPVQLAGQVVKLIDHSIVGGSVTAVGQISRTLGELARRSATGQVATYVLLMFLATSVFVGLFVGK